MQYTNAQLMEAWGRAIARAKLKNPRQKSFVPVVDSTTMQNHDGLRRFKWPQAAELTLHDASVPLGSIVAWDRETISRKYFWDMAVPIIPPEPPEPLPDTVDPALYGAFDPVAGF